jgi:hypothetical protein
MSSFGSRCSALALMIAGCGSPAEVAVFVVLPEVELRTGLAAWNPCQLAGVDRLTLDISGAETFTLTATGCDELEGYWGFFTADEPDGGPLVLAGLAPGYHDVVARLWDQDGTLRGRRARPFAADAPGLDLIFERGDLPGCRQTSPRRGQVPVEPPLQDARLWRVGGSARVGGDLGRGGSFFLERFVAKPLLAGGRPPTALEVQGGWGGDHGRNETTAAPRRSGRRRCRVEWLSSSGRSRSRSRW